MSKTIKKRCERCEEMFEIPLLRKSPAREKLLMYFPCPHCGFIRYFGTKDINKSGRCKVCSIPFVIIDHHSRGLCGRCAMRYYRSNEIIKNKGKKI